MLLEPTRRRPEKPPPPCSHSPWRRPSPTWLCSATTCAVVLAFAITQSVEGFTTWYVSLSHLTSSPAIPRHLPLAGSDLSITYGVCVRVGTKRTSGTRSSSRGLGAVVEPVDLQQEFTCFLFANVIFASVLSLGTGSSI